MKVLYFAWLREKVGTAEETLDLPKEVTTARQLLNWLADRHEGLKEVQSQSGLIRIAINQDYANDSDPVTNTDEIAIFPPVTGG